MFQVYVTTLVKIVVVTVVIDSAIRSKVDQNFEPP